MEDQSPLTSPDGARKRNPPERCPRPLYSQDSAQEERTISQDGHVDGMEAEDVIVIKVKVEDGEEDVRGEERGAEEEISSLISTDAEETPGEVKEEPAEIKQEDAHPKPPCHSRHPAQEERSYPHRGEDLHHVKAEIKEEEETPCVRSEEPYKEEDAPEIGTESGDSGGGEREVKAEEEDTLMEIYPGGSSHTEGYPHPLYHQDSMKEEPRTPHCYQEENLVPAKPEERAEAGEADVRRAEPCAKGEAPPESRTGAKKVSAKDSAEKKKRMMCIELKKEIIEKHDQGVRVVDLAKQYKRRTSTICSILKRKESIKAIAPAKGIKIISKQRTSIHENMEKLLMVWLTEKQLAGDTVVDALICEKARAIYSDLLQQTPGTSTDEASGAPFKGSRGWFENFKKRTGIHSVVRHGEAASADMKAAEDCLKTFAGIIAAEEYIPQQVFNCDETGLFWKKMPRKTYIMVEEKKRPGHKPMKDRLTLALCANASGDCKIKPLLVYHSENPRAFKSHKILKDNMQVLWRANPRAWVTRRFFVEWVNLVFGPEVKKYLQENNLPLQALLVLDSAPAHPPNIEDDILEEFKFIKVLYLPPNATSILQPMDQQVMSNFKKLFTKHLFYCCLEVTESTNLTLREFWRDHYNIVICLTIIDMAWQGVTRRTLTSAWKKLWPEVVSETDFERLESEEAVVEEIVSLGKYMGLDMDEDDINELVEEHSEELTTEELKELEAQQHTEVLQEMGDAEEGIFTSEIKKMLGMWEKLSDFIQKKHPEKVATERAMALFNDACLTHFRKILKGRMKQTSLDRLLSKTPAGESEENVTKKAKTSK